MRLYPSHLLALLLVSSTAIGQTPPPSRPSPTPSPLPAPVTTPVTTPGANPAAAPTPGQANPASIPVQPASDAGATERGLSPVQPGNPGVTRRVQNANTHDLDAQGHVLDPHGKPVGQAASPSVLPATSATVH
jgi:hypothetical protein